VDIDEITKRIEDVAKRLLVLELQQRQYEQQLRADIAAAMSRLVTMNQGQELKIQHMRELLQSFEMTLHVLARAKPGTDEYQKATTMLQEGQRKWASTLCKMVDAYFNLDELQAMVYDLGWDYEKFSGDNKQMKIRSIVDYARRRGTLQLLAGFCQELRPGEQWPLSSTDIV